MESEKFFIVALVGFVVLVGISYAAVTVLL